MLKTCCCRGLQTRPPIRQTNCSLSNIYPYVFKTFDLSFMFHFYVSTYWLSIISENETYDLDVSFLVSCFTFQNTEGALSRSHSVFESLPQCFWIAPTVFLFFSLSVFLNETLKLKMKHKSRMFQSSKVLIINKLKHKNETWKQKAPLVKYT